MVERLERQQKAGETLSPFLAKVLRAAGANGGRLHGPNLTEAAKRVARSAQAKEGNGSD